MKFVRSLPADTVLYSNGYDVINLRTNRPRYGSPLELHATPSRDENEYDRDLELMMERLQATDGYFVYFNGITWRSLATDEELKQDLPLEPAFIAPEGIAYKIARGF